MRIFKRTTQSHRTSRRNGATLVEMALVFPFLITLIFGLVEFARYVMVKQAVTNAAREGAREAALITTSSSSSCDATVRQYLSTAISNSSNTSQVLVTVNPTTLSTATTGSTVSVDVAINYSDVSLFPADFLGSVVIRSRATMKRE